MFGSFQIFTSPQQMRQAYVRHGASTTWGLLMTPGIGLIGAALAIVLWPELLAYFVASLLFCAGVACVFAAWRMRRVGQRLRQHVHNGRPLDMFTPDDWRR